MSDTVSQPMNILSEVRRPWWGAATETVQLQVFVALAGMGDQTLARGTLQQRATELFNYLALVAFSLFGVIVGGQIGVAFGVLPGIGAMILIAGTGTGLVMIGCQLWKRRTWRRLAARAMARARSER